MREGKLWASDIAGFAGVPDDAWTEMCRHCRCELKLHVDTKCLFDTTSFEPMTVGDIKQIIDDQLESTLGWLETGPRWWTTRE